MKTVVDAVRALAMGMCSVLLLEGIAFSAPRTVCFEIFLRDDARINCPSSFGEIGQRRVCQPASTWQHAVGYQVEVWDKDSGPSYNDEYIGSWRLGGAGVNCVTFEWENAPYSHGEPHPDVYLTMKDEARAAAGGVRVRIVNGSGTPYGSVSWREGTSGNSNAFTAFECTGTCNIPTTMTPTSDTSTNYGKALLSMDSAQLMLETYYTLMRNDIVIEVPTTRPICSTACALSRSLVGITGTYAVHGAAAAHELGHALQMQQFEQDSLVNDCSFQGNGWTIGGTEYESCATNEGFATYVAAASWWDPGSGAQPVLSGFGIETSSPSYPTCSVNAMIPGQVARAFWDLDDALNEAGNGAATGYPDTQNLGTLAIAAAWDLFPDGTANRQDRESGINGVNARDYDGNVNVDDTTFLFHNCIQAQQN